MAWNHFVGEHPGGWWWHRTEWLDYALAYAPGSQDWSTAVLDARGTIAALVPAIVGAASYGGQVPPAPLVRGGAGYRGEEEGGPAQAWLPGQVPDIAAPPGCQIVEVGTHVVDLLKPERELFAAVRKSYRGLIRRALAAYALDIVGATSLAPDAAGQAIERARQCHIAAAGRETRAPETWQMQARWMQSGNGLLAQAARGQECVGFAYAVRWKGWAYYFSGATLVPDLSHALIWELMRALRCDGRTRHFEVGHDADVAADQKAKNIAFFKSGFGGTVWPVRMLVPEGLT